MCIARWIGSPMMSNTKQQTFTHCDNGMGQSWVQVGLLSVQVNLKSAAFLIQVKSQVNASLYSQLSQWWSKECSKNYDIQLNKGVKEAELSELYQIEKSLCSKAGNILPKNHSCGVNQKRDTMINVLSAPLYKAAVEILGTIPGAVYPKIRHFGRATPPKIKWNHYNFGRPKDFMQ